MNARSYTLVRCGIAWVIGGAVYLEAVICTVYNGFLSIIFQSIIGAIGSAACVAACLLFGLALRLPVLRRVWSRGMIAPTILAAVGTVLLIYSVTDSQMGHYTDPETEDRFRTLGYSFVPGYFALLFAITNWPFPARDLIPNARNV